MSVYSVVAVMPYSVSYDYKAVYKYCIIIIFKIIFGPTSTKLQA